MEKIRYLISDAADMVHVETHVLRYWEEELNLSIPRNEMGHRYYTRDNIKEFQKIKEWKDQGYQLKAIRIMLRNDKTEDAFMVNTMEDAEAMVQTAEQEQSSKTLSPEDRMSQFRELMSDIIGNAIAQNNEALSQTIGTEVKEQVLKEMNYLMREQDNAQEERYKKLDAAIRGNFRRKGASLFRGNRKQPH